MLPSEKAFSLLELLVIVALVAVLGAVAMPNLFPLKGRAQLQADWSDLVDHLAMFQARAMNAGKIYSACPTVFVNPSTRQQNTEIRAYFNPSGCACSGGQPSTDPGEVLTLENVVLSTCSVIGKQCQPVPAASNVAPVCFYGDGRAGWSQGGTGIIQLQSAKSDCTIPNASECYGEYTAQIHVATGFFDKFKLSFNGQWIETH